jgi:hypothetical protein
MIDNFDQKMGGKKEEIVKEINNDRAEQKNNIKAVNNPNKSDKEKHDKFMNKKRERKTPEEIQKEKEEKLKIRQNKCRKLNSKTTKGQPVMKFKIEHLFDKIKSKFAKGEL